MRPYSSWQSSYEHRLAGASVGKDACTGGDSELPSGSEGSVSNPATAFGTCPRLPRGVGVVSGADWRRVWRREKLGYGHVRMSRHPATCRFPDGMASKERRS